MHVQIRKVSGHESILPLSTILIFNYEIVLILFFIFIELEINNTTGTVRSDSYLHVLRLLIESEGRFRTKYDDNTDDSNFPIVNFSFIRSNIPSAHGVYIQ